MNRLLPAILLCAFSTACSRAEVAASGGGQAATPSATAGVRFEVLSKKRVVESPESQVQVRLRAVNGGAEAIAYPGFAEDMPMYSLEVQENGGWSRYNVGWCGTGLIDFMLKPGSEMSFEITMPADGKTYRASFGDPLLVTPPLVAEAP